MIRRTSSKLAAILIVAATLVSTQAGTARAHEKWFHEGPATSWSQVLETRQLALMGVVAIVTLVAAVLWQLRGKRDLLPGPEAFGAVPAGRSRFYAWVPVILALHVAVPLLV